MSNENLQKWALFAEIVGGIAVLITLMILVLQIGQTNRAIRAQTAQDVWASLNDFSDFITSDRERLAVFNQMTPDLENIDLIESGNYNPHAMIRRLIQVYDNAYYQYQQGTLYADDGLLNF